MGIKDSKLVNLTYEEALKRVTDQEQKKIREAFKRCSTPNGHMSKAVFLKDVLGDGIPVHIAERLYDKFGGSSKGIGLKELICGLVLLTRGKEEEKLKFLFGFYSSEPYQFVDKSEMDDVVLKTEGNVVEEIGDLFKESDQANYETFKSWLKNNVNRLSLSTWLMMESQNSLGVAVDPRTPTFYQTLAGITHLEESDVIELEKQYWQLKSSSKNGKFDLETFSSIVSPPLSSFLCEGMFRTFDENQDNHIDLKELACGISACCRGPTVDRFKFCFKLFDVHRLGILRRTDVMQMISVMSDVRRTTKSLEETNDDELNYKTEEEICSDLLSTCESSSGEFVTQGEYLIWAVKHPLTNNFLNFLVQICHVCLGLRPRTKEEEASIIIPWLVREEREGLKEGQVWYLVSMSWWRTWIDYIQDSVGNNFSLNLFSSSSILPPPTSLENGGISLLSYNKTASSSSSSSSTFYSSPFQSIHDTPTFYSLPLVRGTAVSSVDSGFSPISYATLPRKSSPNLTAVSMSSSLHGESSPSTPAGSPRTSRRVSIIQKPTGVDNSSIVTLPWKVGSLTNEGGILKRDFTLKRKRDFEIVSESVWKVFSLWYGKPLVSLPRSVIIPCEGTPPTLELYPIQVKLLRCHSATNQRTGHSAIYAGMNSGFSGIGMSTSYLNSATDTPPQRYLAYMATFSCKQTLGQIHEFISGKLKISKEDMRLWKVRDETNLCLLEDEDKNLEQLKIFDNQQILIEIRNKDLTWPEEILKMAKNRALVDKSQTEKGATGLNNLGNTCFMNSALQCLSNTQILTAYFTNEKHLYELNRTNPLGARGHLAEKYGQLVKDLWSGQAKSIVPVKLRWTINKYAPCFNDFQQHDSQELLAFVLDGLHEDLNRVHEKPYVELKDSDGRPDEVVAQEAWENHFVRNQSIIVDLFHGQLKSQVRCLQCNHTSVKFDPFTFLSLPLPLESCIHLEVVVISMDISCPVKYGLKMNTDDTFLTLKLHLSKLSCIPLEQLLVVEVYNSLVKGFPQDESKVKVQPNCQLFAYQLPHSFPVNIALQRFTVLSAAAFPSSSPPATMTQFDSMRVSCEASSLSRQSDAISNRSVATTTTRHRCSETISTNFSTFVTTESCGSDDDGGARCLAVQQQQRNECDGCDSNSYANSIGCSSRQQDNSAVFIQQPAVCLKAMQRLHHKQAAHSQDFPSIPNHATTSASTPSSSSFFTRPTNDEKGQTTTGVASDTRTSSSSSHHVTSNGGRSYGGASESVEGNHVGHVEDSENCEEILCERFGDRPQQNGFGGVHNYLDDFRYFSNPVFVVAIHRKMIPSDYYFFWFQRLRSNLFGVPLVLPCHQFTTHQDLYQQVWGLISRLVSPLPPSDATAPNHAQDCDDSLKYEFPFVLKVVQKDNMNCVRCPWYRFCKGCPIECNQQVFNYASCHLAIDWEPTALHLRYHASQEKAFIEHESLEANRKQSVEPIGLDCCLRSFTKEERLDEKELYYCSKCKKHAHAIKKLELWSLPPILIIHLKRFQSFNNRWVKSQKIVKFPMRNFDPTNYLVQRNSTPPSTLRVSDPTTTPYATLATVSPSSLSSSSMSSSQPSRSPSINHLTIGNHRDQCNHEGTVHNGTDDYGSDQAQVCHREKMDPDKNGNTCIEESSSACSTSLPMSRDGCEASAAPACPGSSTSATAAAVSAFSSELTSFSEVSASNCESSGSDTKNEERERYFQISSGHSNIMYNLYAVSCHSGILGCGHYTTYAKNPNGKWYYYNDSSCKEVSEDQVDTNSAYMLFYERQNLGMDDFLGSIAGRKECQNAESDEELDKELKKMCILH